nr:MAG TPA: hypothetical protein [Caudoviricetes sp.]
MKAYRFNPDTLIFEGEQERQIDPVASRKAGKNIYLMPANCTDVEPPAGKDGFDIVFADGKWSYKEQEKKEEPSQPEPYEPTTEDKIAMLDSQYEQDKKTLQGYYLDFMIAGDTEGMESIKGELTALATQYDTDIEVLKGGEE